MIFCQTQSQSLIVKFRLLSTKFSISSFSEHFSYSLFSIEIIQFCGNLGIVVGTTITTPPGPYHLFLKGQNGNFVYHFSVKISGYVMYFVVLHTFLRRSQIDKLRLNLFVKGTFPLTKFGFMLHFRFDNHNFYSICLNQSTLLLLH